MHVMLRRGDEGARAIEELALRLQRRELGFHRHAPRERGDMIIGTPEALLALEVAGIPTPLVDPDLRLILARFEPADLGQRRLDQEVELADLGGDLLLLADELADEVWGCHAQLPISGPISHPCRSGDE